MGKRGRKIIDLTGKKFGRLTVIEVTGKRKNSQVVWLCKCECGNKTEVIGKSLKANQTKSCGCLHDEGPNGSSEIFVEKTNISRLNEKISKNNKSGVRGVSWNKEKRKWSAYITLKRKRKNLGYFDNLQEAKKARKEAEEKYFKPILDKYGKKEE